MRYIIIFFLYLVPISIHAESFVSRDDAFATLWDQINRPVEQTRVDQFVDVEEGNVHYDLLRFAKRRGILDDVEYFYPDSPVYWSDVYRWLLRTRNTHDVTKLEGDGYLQFISDYSLFQRHDPSSQPDSLQQIQDFGVEFDAFLAKQVHEVSLYSEKFHGKGTAFGETFDMNALTAAHPRFPHNTLVRVTNTRDPSRFVVVRVNDRGPFVEGRSMDLSLAAFLQIEQRSKGIANVTLERLGDANILADENLYTAYPHDYTANKRKDRCELLMQKHQQRISKNVYLTNGVPHIVQFGQSITLRASDFVEVRSIYNNGQEYIPFSRYISPLDEEFVFTPQALGAYSITLSTHNTTRTMHFSVEDCATL